VKEAGVVMLNFDAKGRRMFRAKEKRQDFRDRADFSFLAIFT
jgi:hypothetical protein